VIRYALACPDDHAFEGWFRDSAAFETQRDSGLLACPVCSSTEIRKALMTPSVATAEAKDARQFASRTALREEMIATLRKVRRHVTENSDYVGDRFAEEARKIHYEEVEVRGIYGEATADEAKSLHEEGIEVHPLPVLPEDAN
jgi:hypothetical protein